MYFSTAISALLYAFTFTVGGIAAAVPLCPESIDTAGGGPPNNGMPTVISAGAIKELQLAHFLENMEVSFFKASLTNLTEWGTSRFPNDTIEVSKIAAQEEVHLCSIANVLRFYNETLSSQSCVQKINLMHQTAFMLYIVPILSRQTLIPPCNYSFPLNEIEEFFELAHTITSVGIGATIGLNEHLAITDPLS